MISSLSRKNNFYLNCNLCGRYCNVNRHTSTGYCKSKVTAKISSHLLHFGEEPPISGSNGSGTVFFSGCSLGCCFCQNYQISSQNEGTEISDIELADIFIGLQNKGAHNINLVTPTHFTPNIKNAFYIAKENGLNIPVVYNSSGYDSIENLKYIDEIVDIYMPDFKFIDSSLSNKYCNAENYPDTAKAAVEFMFNKKENLILDDNGVAEKGVLIRHLVMPNAVNNSLEILDYLRSNFGNDTYMSLMSQYSSKYKAFNYPEIARPIESTEYTKILNYIEKYSMENIYIQDLLSNKIYFPDFNDTDNPFSKSL